MPTRQQVTYSPLDYTELLQIGGNALLADNIFVFDNLTGLDDNVVSKQDFQRILVKLRLDILVICVGGRLQYNLDCSRPVVLRNGEIAFFRQGQIVELAKTGDAMRLAVIAFPHEMSVGIKGIESMGTDFESVVGRPDGKMMSRLLDLYRLLRSTIEDRELADRKEVVYSFSRIIMVYLSNIMSRESGSKSPREGRIRGKRDKVIYNDFIHLVKENFRKHRDAAFYADRLCITPGHLSRVVKNVSGRNVSEWIRNYVILEAKVLLKSTDLTIFQISDTLNFANPSFFSKYFHQSTGLTPNAYRNRE